MIKSPVSEMTDEGDTGVAIVTGPRTVDVRVMWPAVTRLRPRAVFVGEFSKFRLHDFSFLSPRHFTPSPNSEFSSRSKPLLQYRKRQSGQIAGIQKSSPLAAITR